MAVEALDSRLNMSPVAVSDWLIRRGQETCAGDKYGHANADGQDQYNEQKPANGLTRLCRWLTEIQATSSTKAKSGSRKLS